MKTLRYLFALSLAVMMAACGGKKEQASEEASSATESEFQASQPVASGLYNADHFAVTGPEARKGSFDGRIIFSLSEEKSALFVFENGNRTKISNLLMLAAPFAKDGSNYTAQDKNGQTVTVNTDSAFYTLRYIAGADTLCISFDPKPRTEYTPFEALEKINEQAQKK